MSAPRIEFTEPWKDRAGEPVVRNRRRRKMRAQNGIPEKSTRKRPISDHPLDPRMTKEEIESGCAVGLGYARVVREEEKKC